MKLTATNVSTSIKQLISDAGYSIPNLDLIRTVREFHCIFIDNSLSYETGKTLYVEGAKITAIPNESVAIVFDDFFSDTTGAIENINIISSDATHDFILYVN